MIYSAHKMILIFHMLFVIQIFASCATSIYGNLFVPSCHNNWLRGHGNACVDPVLSTAQYNCPELCRLCCGFYFVFLNDLSETILC
jgi:hypothetical protein